MEQQKVLISGRWLSGAVFLQKKSPFDNQTVYEFIEAGVDLVDSAVISAKTAFQEWKSVSIANRKSILQNFAGILDAKKEEIVESIHLDMGKPKIEAEVEVIEIIDIISFYVSSEYPELERQKVEINTDVWVYKKAFQCRVPIDVYAFIKPWRHC